MDDITTKPSTNEDKAKDILARYDSLKAKREGFYDSAWRSAAEWMSPRKSSLMNAQKTPGETGWVDNLYDTTAMKANERLAAWLMTNTSPTNNRWFSFTSSPTMRRATGENIRVNQWWQQVTAITLEQLATSNFYTEKHEAVLDRNTFGTCCLFIQKGKRHPLNFRSIECSTYVIGTNDEGYVDTVMREFKLSVRQAVQQFGVESLGPKIREKHASGTTKDKDTEFTFIHSVFPNFDRQPGYDDQLNKPFSSCYVCKEDKTVVQEGGYDEMPYAVSRFLKWTGEEWGWSPAFTALPVVRETNFFKMQMNALAELAAFPPMAIPDNLAGQLDMRAGGKNVYDSNRPDALPRPLYSIGNFDIGKDLLETNRQFIEQCFYGDVVAMFTNLDREITAYEAAQLSGEKLDVFSPYYHRLINELDTPVLQRAFSVLLAEGMYPEPPVELLRDNGDGTGTIDFPEVTYLSRLALAIQAHEIGAFDALVARAMQLAQIDPALGAAFMSNYDLDRTSRGLGRNMGIPVEWQKSQDELDAEREAAAQAAQQQQMVEAAPQLAKAAKDVDSLSPSAKSRLQA
jgi:hypothetical protein